MLVIGNVGRDGTQRKVADQPVEAGQEDVGLMIAILGLEKLADLVHVPRDGTGGGCPRKRIGRVGDSVCRVNGRYRIPDVLKTAGTDQSIGLYNRNTIVEMVDCAHCTKSRREEGVPQARRGVQVTARKFCRCANLPDILGFVFQRQFEVVIGCPYAGHAKRRIVANADWFAGRYLGITRVVERVRPSSHANPERIAQRPADSELEGGLLVTAIGQGDIPLHRIARPAADGIQCACCGALSRKSGLRSPHDFQPLQIEECVLAQVIASVVDAVVKLCDSLFECLVRRRSADSTNRQPLADKGIAHVQVRDKNGEVVHVGESGPLKRHAGQRRYRDRHVLETFLAPRRGHDDFLQLCKSGWRGHQSGQN